MIFSEVSLDIETRNPDRETLEKERLTIKIDKRVKDPAKVKEKQDEKLAQGGLLNLAPVGCIGLLCDHVHINLNTFPLTLEQQSELLSVGVFPLSFPTEKEMLSFLTRFFNQLTNEETMLVTHNGEKFDVPRIRARSSFWDVSISPFLSHRNRFNHFDTMVKFGKGFAHRDEERKFVSLERICHTLGVDFVKSLYKGAEVPDAIDRGEYVNVIKYNNLGDCRATSDACHKMLLQM